jgi:hypothetical protein
MFYASISRKNLGRSAAISKNGGFPGFRFFGFSENLGTALEFFREQSP